MLFSERLRSERIQHGFNQQYIAKYLQVSQVSVSNWERGIKEPNFQSLIELSKLFNKSTDYMLGLKDE